MRILIGEHDKWNDRPLYEALVQALRANDIAGVTVYRGILGYGANRRIHKDSALNLSHDAPILLTVVDSETKLRAFFPVWTRWSSRDWWHSRMLTLSSIPMLNLCRDAGGGEMKLEGKAKMLRIHFGEDDQWHGRPLYQAIVERCRELDIAGATVYRGIEGYGASTLIRRSHMLRVFVGCADSGPDY